MTTWARSLAYSNSYYVAGSFLPLAEPNIMLFPIFHLLLLPVKATCMFDNIKLYLMYNKTLLHSHMINIHMYLSGSFNMYLNHQQSNLISNIGSQVHMDFPRWSCCCHFSLIVSGRLWTHEDLLVFYVCSLCESGLFKSCISPLFISLFFWAALMQVLLHKASNFQLPFTVFLLNQNGHMMFTVVCSFVLSYLSLLTNTNISW